MVFSLTRKFSLNVKAGAVVAISIDGQKEVHDQMRVDSSGKGTFDEVIRSYRLAQQSGVKTGICVTIDQHNIFQMKEIVQWVADKLGVKGMGFNILIDNTTKQIIDEHDRYAEIVAQGLIESFKVARAAGIYEDRMMRRVKNFLDKEPVLSDCGGCGLQIVISPDGKIGVCQAFAARKNFSSQSHLKHSSRNSIHFGNNGENVRRLPMKHVKTVSLSGTAVEVVRITPIESREL